MAMLLDSIVRDWPQTEIDGKWCLAKPVIKPFLWRLKDAWGVLTGRYGAHAYIGEESRRKKMKA